MGRTLYQTEDIVRCVTETISDELDARDAWRAVFATTDPYKRLARRIVERLTEEGYL